MKRSIQASKLWTGIYSGFTVTETERRKLKWKEYDWLRLKTWIKRSTHASGIYLSFTVTETGQRKLICEEYNLFELKT